MPKKSTPPLTDEERAKRIRETAREVEASDSGKEFERAFKKIVPSSKDRGHSRKTQTFPTTR
jgi:hypothetical protein